MPQAYTPIDQTILSMATPTPDAYLKMQLAGGYLYNIYAYLVWAQAAPAQGGIQVGLYSDAAAALSWSAPASGNHQAHVSGDMISPNDIATVSGNQAIMIHGVLQAPALLNLGVQWAQATSNINVTMLRANSILLASVIPPPGVAPALAILPSFVAPLNPQGYMVPIPSPLGTTVMVGATSTPVIGPRATRRGIAFSNPNPTTSIFVCPDNQQAVPGQGIQIVPGGFVPLMGNDQSLINVTSGWNACTATGPTIPLSILEFV